MAKSYARGTPRKFAEIMAMKEAKPSMFYLEGIFSAYRATASKMGSGESDVLRKNTFTEALKGHLSDLEDKLFRPDVKATLLESLHSPQYKSSMEASSMMQAFVEPKVSGLHKDIVAQHTQILQDVINKARQEIPDYAARERAAQATENLLGTVLTDIRANRKGFQERVLTNSLQFFGLKRMTLGEVVHNEQYAQLITENKVAGVNREDTLAFMRKIIANNNKLSEMEVDGIFKHASSGDVVDLRNMKMGLHFENALSFLEENFHVPIVHFNPIRMLGYSGIRERRKVPFVGMVRAGDLNPFLPEELKDKFGAVGKDLLYYKTGVKDVYKMVDLKSAQTLPYEFVPVSARYGQQSTYLKQIAGHALYHPKPANSVIGRTFQTWGNILDIGKQEVPSRLERELSRFTKFSNANYEKNTIDSLLKKTPEQLSNLRQIDLEDASKKLNSIFRKNMSVFSPAIIDALKESAKNRKNNLFGFMDKNAISFATTDETFRSFTNLIQNEKIETNELKNLIQRYQKDPEAFQHIVTLVGNNKFIYGSRAKVLKAEDQIQRAISMELSAKYHQDIMELSSSMGKGFKEKYSEVAAATSFLEGYKAFSRDVPASTEALNNTVRLLQGKSVLGDDFRTALERMTKRNYPSWAEGPTREMTQDVQWGSGGYLFVQKGKTLSNTLSEINAFAKEGKPVSAFNALKSYGAQFLAGRKEPGLFRGTGEYDLSKITAQTIATPSVSPLSLGSPYWFANRLADLLSGQEGFQPLPLGLSSQSRGSAGSIYGAILGKRVFPAMAAVSAMGYLDYELNKVTGEGLQEKFTKVFYGTQLDVAKARDTLGLTEYAKRRKQIFPGIEYLTEMPGSPLRVVDPLGIFFWPAKSEEEMKKDMYYGGYPVRKGRFWSLGCLTASSVVSMANGEHKPISTIIPGEYVFDMFGNSREVKDVIPRELTSEDRVYKIFVGDSITGVTGNHPFWAYKNSNTKPDWVRADELQANESFVCFPKPVLSSEKLKKIKEMNCEDIIETNNSFFIRIKKIIDITSEYKGLVWDLVVPSGNFETDSFLADGIAVHNSTPFVGERIDYFSAHPYRTGMSRWKEASNVFGGGDLYWSHFWLPTPRYPLCMLPDQEVYTSELVPIKAKDFNLQIENLNVYSSDGKEHKIYGYYEREADEEAVEIRITGRSYLPLKLTSKHPVLSIKRSDFKRKSSGQLWFCKEENISWHDAGELEIGDIVVSRIPIFDEQELLDIGKFLSDKFFVTDEFVYITLQEGVARSFEIQEKKDFPKGFHGQIKDFISSLDIDSKDWNNARDKFKIGRIPRRISRYTKLDYDLGYLFGWYLAEGSLHRSKGSGGTIKWTMNAKEEDIAKKLSSILYSKFGANSRILIEGNTLRLFCSCNILYFLLDNLFSHGSANKKIHKDLFHTAKEFRKGLLDAYIVGDGCKEKGSENRVRAVSVSRKLIEGMGLLAESLGYITTLHKKKDASVVYILEKLCNSKTSYELSICFDDYRAKSKNDGKYVYRLISEIKKYHYKGKVFDISIEDCEDFSVFSCIIHNSPIRHFLTDPYWWEKSMQKERPFEMTGQLFQEETPWGSILNATVGRILKPTRVMHQDETMLEQGPFGNIYNSKIEQRRLNELNLDLKRQAILRREVSKITPSGIMGGPQQRMAPRAFAAVSDTGVPLPTGLIKEMNNSSAGVPGAVGISGGTHEARDGVRTQLALTNYASKYNPDSELVPARDIGRNADLLNAELLTNLESPSDPLVQTKNLWYSLTEQAGIFGFAGKSLTESLGGYPNPRLQTAQSGYGAEQSWWQLGLGGLGENLSEFGRRFLPHRQREIRLVNTVRNTQPYWLPGTAGYEPGYFIDFSRGDYSKIPMGIIRLPGAAYEKVNNVKNRLGHIAASNLGKPMSEIVQRILDPSIPTTEAMEKGTEIHREIQRRFRKAGRLIAAEGAFTDTQLNIQGQYDAIVKTQNDIAVVEIKTVNEKNMKN